MILVSLYDSLEIYRCPKRTQKRKIRVDKYLVTILGLSVVGMVVVIQIKSLTCLKTTGYFLIIHNLFEMTSRVLLSMETLIIQLHMTHTKLSFNDNRIILCPNDPLRLRTKQ